MNSTIGQMNDGVYALRGTPVPDLIREADFVSTLWLAWTGARPTEPVKRLINACLSACVDHGTEPPSAQATRAAASEGKTVAQSVAAGISTFGPVHGNAATPAARWISAALSSGQTAEQVVATFEQAGERIPGVGHRVYETDPRTDALFMIARETLTSDAALTLITDVARILSAKKGKTMPVNVDGALGAIIAALGVDAEIADQLFITARSAGLSAHAREASV